MTVNIEGKALKKETFSYLLYNYKNNALHSPEPKQQIEAGDKTHNGKRNHFPGQIQQRLAI
jgi:hypothetical protein